MFETRNLDDYVALLERIPQVFQRAWDSIAVYDIAGAMVVANDAAAQLVGAPDLAQLRGRHFSAHMTLESATAASRTFASVLTTGKSVTFETTFAAMDGRAMPVLVKLAPATIDATIVGVIAFARDLSDRPTAERHAMMAEQHFRSIFEQHPDAIAILDAQGRFVRVNAGAQALFGYSMEELLGQTPALTSPSGVWDERMRILGATTLGRAVEFESVILSKNGELKDIEGQAMPLTTDGDSVGTFLIARDVTRERSRTREASRQAKRIAELYRIASTTSIPVDEKISRALAAGMRELRCDWGFAANITDGIMTITTTSGGEYPYRPGDTVLLETAIMRHVVEANDLYVIEDLRASPLAALLDGARTKWRSYIGLPLNVDGALVGVIGFTNSYAIVRLSETDREYIRAIAALIASALERLANEKRLDTLAFHDPLTGIPNRALLDDRLDQTLLAARRHSRAFAAHYIDVDRFKEINDTFGHHAGDTVLIAVAKWLRSLVRESDTLARIGGDEFVILQPEISSPAQAIDLATRIGLIRDCEFQSAKQTLRVTVSVGIGLFPTDATSAEDLLQAADTALYRAKRRGRDGFALANDLAKD